MIRIFKKKPKKPNTRVPVKEVYRTPDGTVFYEFENHLQIPARRAIAAEVATRMADMNLTKERLRMILEKMREFGNKGDIVSLFSLISEVEFRIDYLGEEETLREFAVLYFLIDGEEADIVDEVAKRKKLELFQKYPEAEAFFLKAAFGVITAYSSTSEEDILDYLRKNATEASRLINFLQEQ